MRRLVLVVVVVLVALVGGGYAWWRTHSSSTPVSERQALATYRSGATAAWHGDPPAPGVYTYVQHGWECGGIGPICLRRSLPSRARLIVQRSGRATLLELDLSRQHLEAQRLVQRAAGQFLTWQRTRLSLAGVTQDVREAARPPVLEQPARLHVGQRWTQRFDTGGVPVSAVVEVVGRVRMHVGPRVVSAYVVRSVSKTGGPHAGTEVDRSWYAPALGIDVREDTSRHIGGVFPYRLEVSATLLDARPAA